MNNTPTHTAGLLAYLIRQQAAGLAMIAEHIQTVTGSHEVATQALMEALAEHAEQDSLGAEAVAAAYANILREQAQHYRQRRAGEQAGEPEIEWDTGDD